MKAILAAVLIVSSGGAAQEPHSFNDKTNLALFSADMLARTLDWNSTRMILGNPCKCFKEDQLPMVIAGSSSKLLAYSLSVSAAVHGAAFLAHKTGHHKLERLIPMLDIIGDGSTALHNYAISGKRAK